MVKQIEVANVRLSESANNAYVKLLSVKASPRSAQIEIDVNQSGKTVRKVVTVKNGQDLYELSNGRGLYNNFTVNDIYIEKGKESIKFLNGAIVHMGESLGELDGDSIKRLQIQKTIKEHFEKEKFLNPQGIKVLSLFFIDRVANYREYDSEGNPQKGKYAQWFEEEYKQIIKQKDYADVFNSIKDLDTEVEKIHNGYFSKDKKGILKESTGNNADDEDTFNLIMKDKEKLLSFESSLRFIFSHSALKEGWDNPNVFQICTLNETNSAMKKRQEIGRGLRICVNQEGERVYGFENNTLTVMANESYEEFAKSLQSEIESEEGIKFGVIQEHFFANLSTKNDVGEIHYLGFEKSEALLHFLLDKGYINTQGKIQDTLKIALKENTFKVPEEFASIQENIIQSIKKVAGGLNIKDASDKKLVTLHKQILLGEDFQALWNEIKYKTTYRVDFDVEALVDTCAKKIANELTCGKIKYIYSKAKNKITRVGIEVDENSISITPHDVKVIQYQLPDIVTYLQNETKLTRKNIVDILIQSEKIESFKNNPQKFIDGVIAIIRKTMSIFIVDGIKYHKIGDAFYYAQECFEDKELYGYLSSNMYKNRENKSIYDYTVYDSDIEKSFAKSFNENENVKLFTKLPSWFKINTPLGGYNPDWAVLIEKDNEEKLYFVVESKGSLFSDDLRDTEEAKIHCAKKHFNEISSKATLVVSNTFQNFSENF